MNLSTFNTCIADLARPMSIVILSLGLTVAIFVPNANATIAAIAGTLAGGLVGARSFENHTQIKAEAEVKKTIVGGQNGQGTDRITVPKRANEGDD